MNDHGALVEAAGEANDALEAAIAIAASVLNNLLVVKGNLDDKYDFVAEGEAEESE